MIKTESYTVVEIHTHTGAPMICDGMVDPEGRS
jgi:hypothetical protein